jgi:hypothetical protein
MRRRRPGVLGVAALLLLFAAGWFGLLGLLILAVKGCR